ncbi:MAG: sec-independent protein translocase protein TatC [Acidobacteriota bacterium]|jgi:sec-independent protein translocase protein TatC|nr:sec-independent protein translocase protein TatC [Acidobacteriota bacterium]
MTDTEPRAPETRRGRGRHPDDSRMTLVEHLTELRGRMVKSALALLVGVVVAYVFFPQIFEFLQRPYCALSPKRRLGGEDCRLLVTGVLDQFLVRMKVSLMGGALLSSPVWLWQLWRFVTPGLHDRERRWAVPFVSASVVLFAAGATFSYFTLSNGLSFLLSIGGEGVTSLLTVDKYLSFVTLMLLAFGVSFEFPVLMIFLNIIGVTPTERLRKWRRAMFFGLSVFAAVITPSQDPFTFLAMWIPLCLFYEVSILFGRIRDRARGRRDTESTDQWADDETSPI